MISEYNEQTSLSLLDLDTMSMLDMIPADIVVFDLDHRYTYINKNGVKNETIRTWLIGRDDFDYCKTYNKPLSIAEQRRLYFKQCLQTKQPLQFTEIFETPAGNVYCVRAMCPVLDSDNNVTCVVGYGYNDTFRIKSESELNKIKVALDYCKDGVAVLDKDGVYTYMNSAHATIFDYESPQELIGKTWQVIYDEPEAQKIITDYMPQLAIHGFWNGSTRGLSKLGREVIQDITLTGLPDGGLICITRDQTELRRIYQEAKRLAIIAEKTKGLVAITNSKGELTWANESFYHKTGFKMDEMIGQPLVNILSSDYLEGRANLDLIRKDITFKGEFQGKICIKRKDGSPFWMLLNVSKITDHEGRLSSFVLLQLDFNDFHEIEKKLYESAVKERNLNQIKSKFINVTSHEIRTPLTNIEFYTELIRLKYNPEDAVVEYLDKISNQVSNITRILDDFLVLSKTGNGNISMNLRELDVIEKINNLFASGIVGNATHRIVIDIEGDPFTIRLDENLFQIVIKNLVENALKFSKPESNVNILVKYKTDYLLISVTDFGIGIPKSEQDKLFNSFYRASNAEFIKGSGLGLTIVKEFVTLLGGEISFTSKEGKFTTFTLKFKK